MGKTDYKTAERLLTLVELARSGTKLSIDLIKRRFRVEKATASRYLRFARNYSGLRSRSRGGRKIHEASSEREGAFLRVASLELALLSMGWLQDTPYHAHIVELIREMRTHVAVEDHDELERFVRSFYFKRRKAAHDRKHADTTDRLLTAIRERRVCHATYQRLSGEVVEYILEPWSLMLIGDAAFVLAGERSRAGARTFELSSIASLTVLDETFTSPSRAESDAATLLGNSIGSYAANYNDQEDVTLRVRGQADVLLRRRPLHSSQTLEPGTTGWTTMRVRVVVCPELVSAVLSLLPDVRVVGPASLREAVGMAASAATGSDWDPGIRE